MKRPMLRHINRSLAFVLAVVVALNSVTPVYCQAIADLPSPGSGLLPTAVFNPPLLKGIRISPVDPLRFDFILDQGDGVLSEKEIRADSLRLIRYFFAGLTIPEKDLWVNLSPYEKDRIIPEDFGRTEMGRDLLSQDYLLKQLTSSLIDPEAVTGREFWRKVYALAQAKYGTTDIPVEVFNKVWIVPETAELYENSRTGSAYITHSRLRVMSDKDYHAGENDSGLSGGLPVPVPEHGEQDIVRDVMREVVVPVLENEINEGSSFSRLRQVYHSVVLAAWYKKTLWKSVLSAAYVDRRKTAGIDIENPGEAQQIWQRYLEGFRKGTYNLVREEKDVLTNEIISRRYIGGGVTLKGTYRVSANGLEAVSAFQPVLVSCKAEAVADSSQTARIAGSIRALLQEDSGQKELQNLLEGLLQDNDVWRAGDLLSELKMFAPDKNFSAAMEKALVNRSGQLSGEEDIKERQRLAQFAEIFFSPYLDVRAESWQEVWGLFVEDEQVLGKLLTFVALLRKIYPFQHFPADPPFRMALEKGSYYRLANNLFVTPLSHSFRKHLLFATGQEGQIIFVVEFMVPGEREDKLFIGADNRMKIAGDIDEVWGEKKIQSIPLRFLEKKTAGFHMYGKDLVFDAQKRFQVLFMEYPFDGVRMNFFSDRKIRYRYAQALGVSIRDLAREIIAKTAEVVASYEALGIVGFIGIGFDAHTGNLRVSFLEESEGSSWQQRVRVSTVSDYYGFQKLADTASDRESSLLIERRLYIEGAAGTPGLSEMFYESEYSRRDYYEIFRQAYVKAAEALQARNSGPGNEHDARSAAVLSPVNVPDIAHGQVLVKSAPGGIDLGSAGRNMHGAGGSPDLEFVIPELFTGIQRAVQAAPGIAPEIVGVYFNPDLETFLN